MFIETNFVIKQVPLENIPRNPFFSDRNHCFNFGTRLIYAVVQTTRSPKTTNPSKEYAKIKIIIVTFRLSHDLNKVKRNK